MRRTSLLLFAPLLLLVGAAAARAPGPVRTGGAVSCIDTHDIVTRYPQPPGSVVFEMAGGITYRNDLIGACPGVARADSNSIVQLETDGTRLCANDSVRVYDPVEARGVGARAFAKCRLGAFTPIASR
ncbi:MAG: hypothetical protein JWO81_1485 [Alphaproteobacteria bacterium]|nr:hypothetical protein [Alphaproteobacteria bacterium]